MFNPQWLTTFRALAEIGSFTRTAEKLDLTQAAVSQQIRQLETQTGVLFIRRPRRLELTPAGAAMLDYCRELQAMDARLQARLSGAEAEVGPVSLITPGSIGLFLHPLLLDLQAASPGLVIRHRFAPDHEVLDAVLKNQYELGIVTLRPDDTRIAAQAFLEEPLELVVPAGEKVNDWSDLQRLGFIDHPDGQAMASRLLSRTFPGSSGVSQLPIKGFGNQIGLLLEPVARGFGFTVIPRYARVAFRRPEAIQVLETAVPVLDSLWLIHRSEWALSRRARRVADHLQQAAQALRIAD